MSFKQTRYICSANSFFFAFLLSVTVASPALACTRPIMQSAPPDVINDILARAGEYFKSADKRPPGPVDIRFASKSEENFASLIRSVWLDPRPNGINGRRSVGDDSQNIVAMYFGDDMPSSSKSEMLLLPQDATMLCLLFPFEGIFLSDGATHHYAVMYDVDYENRIVTLADPWASESFLLPGRNLLGVKARSVVVKPGFHALTLSFDDFVRSTREIVVSSNSLPNEYLFDTIEQEYPKSELGENFKVWAYEGILSTGNFDSTMLVAIKLASDKDVEFMPRLALLRSYADDASVGLATGFSQPRIGVVIEDKKEIAALRSAFVARLKDYAKELPWSLRSYLVDRAELGHDRELALQIVDSFIAADAGDVDFRIRRAQLLVKLGRLADAEKEILQALRSWQTEVAATIDVSPSSEAINLFLEKDWGLVSHDLFHWQYALVHSTMAIIELKKPFGGRISKSSSVNEIVSYGFPPYHHQTDVNQTAGEFLPEFLYVMSLADKREVEEQMIEASLLRNVPSSDKERNDNIRYQYLVRTVYRHLSEHRSIAALSQHFRSILHSSPAGKDICALAGTDFSGDLVPNLSEDFEKFCK